MHDAAHNVAVSDGCGLLRLPRTLVSHIAEIGHIDRDGHSSIRRGSADWNRYPGARFNSESWTYGYSFSKQLLQEWDWKEHFSPQPDTLAYLNHVADKFDLRRDMQFAAASNPRRGMKPRPRGL